MNGWKFVPLDPTREMLDAAFGACSLATHDWLAIRYRAMVLAAPRGAHERLSEDHILTLYAQVFKNRPPPPGQAVAIMAFAKEIEFATMQSYLVDPKKGKEKEPR